MSGGQEKKLSGEQLCLKREIEKDFFIKVRNCVFSFFQDYTTSVVFEKLLQWDQWKDGEVFHHTIKELSEQLGIPTRTLERHIKKITDTGVITTEVHYKDKQSLTKTTFYYVHWDEIVKQIKVTKPPKRRDKETRPIRQNDGYQTAKVADSSIRGTKITNLDNCRKSENRHSDSECVEQASPVSLSVNIESLINEEETIMPNKEDEIVENSKLKKDESEMPEKESALTSEQKNKVKYKEEGSFVADTPKRPKYNKFDEDCSEQLRKVLREKGFVARGTVGKWADAFRLLREKDDLSQEEIKEVLDFYLSKKDVWSITYAPIIGSATGFRDKYDKFVSYMQRNQSSIESAEEESDEEEWDLAEMAKIAQERRRIRDGVCS